MTRLYICVWLKKKDRSSEKQLFLFKFMLLVRFIAAVNPAFSDDPLEFEDRLIVVLFLPVNIADNTRYHHPSEMIGY